MSEMPVRTCFACRASLDKHAMLRLVMDEAGVLWPDLRQRAPGRGTYLCMRKACLARMNDKRMRALSGKFPGVVADWSALCRRIADVLTRQVRDTARRLRAKAALGRDAVMQRMWNNTPLVVLLADDAGEALRRQVHDAVEKRRADAGRTILLRVPGDGWLAGVFDRGLLSVAALEASGQTAGMVENCVWLGRLKELGYI
ncbi:MAG: YlxR family protein [Zetaproteobacteria bacterium]|nr:MAG: YlxR family protein [Zetaproteobacteria bacterium]